MTMRSGRFTQARTIIKGRSGTFFRILNSAEFSNLDQTTNQITVTFGSGPGNSAVVLPTFSLDFLANGDVSVDGTGVVEGIYDSLPNADVKNGRFRTKNPMNATVGVQIISPGGGNASAIYRIFNSGPVSIQLFTTNPNGGSPMDFELPILENESFDFVTPNNKSMWVKGTGGANDHIEGIYDFIART